MEKLLKFMVFCTIIVIAEMGCDMINDLKEQKQDGSREEVQIAGSGSPVERQLYGCASLWSNLEFGSRSTAAALQIPPNRGKTLQCDYPCLATPRTAPVSLTHIAKRQVILP